MENQEIGPSQLCYINHFSAYSKKKHIFKVGYLAQSELQIFLHSLYFSDKKL